VRPGEKVGRSTGADPAEAGGLVRTKSPSPAEPMGGFTKGKSRRPKVESRALVKSAEAALFMTAEKVGAKKPCWRASWKMVDRSTNSKAARRSSGMSADVGQALGSWGGGWLLSRRVRGRPHRLGGVGDLRLPRRGTH